jgi:hypothetical protein
MKPLKIIGIQRVNGNCDFVDWNTRKYHKSCYKIKIQMRAVSHLSEIVKHMNNYNYDDVDLTMTSTTTSPVSA